MTILEVSGNDTDEQLYQKISDTLTLLATGGDRR